MMTADLLLSRLSALPQASAVRPHKSDHDLNPGWPLPVRPKPAAVLVPLVRRSDQLGILLTRRQPHLSEHAGQVSFPGGRIDAADADAAAAALREAHEEVGLLPGLVRPLGWLDTYVTFTGYRVEPLVGVISSPPVWQISPGEVAEAFELPLAAVLQPGAFSVREHKVPGGQVRRTYVMTYGGYDIWGATAAMLVDLRDRLVHED